MHLKKGSKEEDEKRVEKGEEEGGLMKGKGKKPNQIKINERMITER